MKFKKTADPKQLVKIDENGATTFSEYRKDSNGKTNLGTEMQEWLKIPGNKLEPQVTAEEQAENDAAEAVQAWESTKSICIKYLDESEKHVTNDAPYPENLQKWLDSRAGWRAIIRAKIAQEVPPKPF